VPDFQSPAIHDEVRFSIRKGMMQDNVKEAMTFRNSSDQTALPVRRWKSFSAWNWLRRLVCALERPELPLPDCRFHIQDASRAALWEEFSRSV
jgi:hypothetical protein